MSPRSEERNKQIRDERREQIIWAALKVFARKGLAAAKVSDIAAEAGLSHGLVYHYFGSKDQLFTELVKIAVHYSSATVVQAVQKTGRPWDRIRWMTDVINGVTGNGAYFFLIMLQALTLEDLPKEAKQLALEGGESPIQLMVPLIIEAQQAGQVVQDDPVRLAVAYFALLNGLALARITSLTEIPMPGTDTILQLLRPLPKTGK